MEDIQITFLTKVLDCIIKDTSIKYVNVEGGSTTPFFYVDHTFYIHRIFLKNDLPGPAFKEYCENNYGLSELDIIYVWEVYKLVIESRLKMNR